jgi:outer membrane protein TolC
MREKNRFAVLSTALLLIFGAGPGPGSAQESPGKLQLGDFLVVVRDRNPRLRAALSRVHATRSREAEAGLLPDPKFLFGVANLALPELSATMPASMAPSFQATQRFPLAGKRSVRREIARQSTEIDGASAEELWWSVRTDAVASFFELYRVDRQAEVLQNTLELLEDFATIALSRYSAGSGPQADVLRASVAVARMEADLHRLASMRQGVVSRLNALAGRPGSTSIPTPELPVLPSDIPAPELLMRWALDTKPAIQAMQLAVRRAESNRDLAEKAVWPDLTVGVQYGLGRMDGDPTSMAGASIGFSVPAYAGKRQRKLREEAAALESVARAQLEGALVGVDTEVARIVADLDWARTLLRLYQEDILPQARVAVESSLSSYRVGSLDFLSLIDAQLTVNTFEGEYYELLASYGKALAQLEQAIGRDLPVGGNPLLEVR